jgi:hypothetical protein
MYAAFATGLLTWHEAAKSNSAAEAKEADQLEVMALSASSNHTNQRDNKLAHDFYVA